MSPEICFPKLGIQIEKINRIAISILGIDIYWYGIIIVSSIILGYFLLSRWLKKQNESVDEYLNLLIICLITSLIGARTYFVLFSFDYYKNNIMKIFDYRSGGIAIYGAVIASILTILVYSKVNKKSFYKYVDTLAPYLVLGQACGRWGNFINKEAFGSYTNNIFAMAIRKDCMNYIPKSLNGTEILLWGKEYFQVQPTFLYESICSLLLFIFLIWYRSKKKKFDGEIFYLYIFFYSSYRFFIEGLRTDQLKIGNFAISQIVAITLIIISIIMYVYLYIKNKNKKKLKKEN